MILINFSQIWAKCRAGLDWFWSLKYNTAPPFRQYPMNATHPNADGLLAAAKTGDLAQLGQLMELYRDYLRLLARIEIGKKLQGKVDASDLVQEVFLDAHRQFPSFHGEAEGQFIQWLRRIMAGTLARQLRHYVGTKARDIRLEVEIGNDLDHSANNFGILPIDPQGSPSQQVNQAEQSLLVAKALAKLSEDYQKVILLRHFEGLTFPEVANRMEKSVDSVEKLWLRGIAKLKKAFGGQP